MLNFIIGPIHMNNLVVLMWAVKNAGRLMF